MNPNRNHCLNRNLSHFHSFHLTVYCQSQIRWDLFRLAQSHYHLVPMILILSPMACCHSANPTAIHSGIQTANRIESQIQIGSQIRFGIHYFLIHCCRKVWNQTSHLVH
jgi:hypothetical protein